MDKRYRVINFEEFEIKDCGNEYPIIFRGHERHVASSMEDAETIAELMMRVEMMRDALYAIENSEEAKFVQQMDIADNESQEELDQCRQVANAAWGWDSLYHQWGYQD